MRDVVADNPNTFEIHKLEHLKDTQERKMNHEKTENVNTNTIIMRLECESEEEKDDWVKAINREVKTLRSKVDRKRIQFWII